jgi:hypothetical protein
LAAEREIQDDVDDVPKFEFLSPIDREFTR